MKEIEKLVGLGKDYKIKKVEELLDKNKEKVKYIYVDKNAKKAKCPTCGKYTSSIHDKLKPMKLKYIKAFEYKVYILIEKRRFVCHKCNKKFTEEDSLNSKNGSVTNKLKMKVLKDLLQYNLSLKYIAKENNISDNEVRKILKEVMSGYPEHVKNLPRIISFDEFKADTKEGKYAFIINDPIHKKAIDILPNRKKEYLIQYFTYTENRHSVEFVISDMYEPYLLVTQIMFPKAKYVVDPFHYTRYIMEALDKIRIRLQENYGYNSYEYRLLKNKKNVSLLRKYSNEIDWFTYSKRYKNGHMVEILNYDIREQLLSINDELKRGYQLKELFLDIIKHSNYKNALQELELWIELCKESEIEEFIEASNAINNWIEYIVNSFIDKRFSNGYTEGLNNKIKVIKRVGFGYKDFWFFRKRLLYILNGKIIINLKKEGFQKNEKIKK